jgi:very-short-patch-repair endonuclease
LEKLGLTVLRFDDLEVKKDMKEVLDSLEKWILLNESDK